MHWHISLFLIACVSSAGLPRMGEDRLAYSREAQTQDCSAQEGVLPSPVSDLGLVVMININSI